LLRAVIGVSPAKKINHYAKVRHFFAPIKAELPAWGIKVYFVLLLDKDYLTSERVISMLTVPEAPTTGKAKLRNAEPNVPQHSGEASLAAVILAVKSLWGTEA
jgi:hypothetical protein